MTETFRLWDRFWFSPGSAAGLGFFRAAFFGACFAVFLYKGPVPVIPLLDWNPGPVYQWLLPLPSAEWLQSAWKVWMVAILFSCLGMFTRVSVTLSFLLAVYTLGFVENLGGPGNGSSLLGVFFAVLAFSPCGDAFSLDAFWRRRRGKPITRREAWEYFWPIQLLRTLFALFYLQAGAWKLKNAGLAWVSTDNLRALIFERGRPFGLWLSQFPLLCKFLASGTVISEGLAPLALFSMPARIVLIGALLLMHVLIFIAMGIDTSFTAVCFLAWLPWERAR